MEIKKIKLTHSQWFYPNSDLLTWLNAIISYGVQGITRGDVFCHNNYLHAKTMKEIFLLRQQLTDIINAEEMTKVKLDFTQKLEQPTKEQKALLRQIITAGLIDRVAKRMPEIDEEGRELKNRYRYLLLTTNEFAKIHPESFLNQASPEYIVYHQYIQSLKATKPFLKGITAVRPTWLVDLGLPLTDFSEPLKTPPVFYDEKNDRIMCYTKPYFGPYRWELPVTDIEYPKKPEKYRHFAKLLLEGAILPELKALQSHLVSSPSIIILSTTHNTITTYLINALSEKQVDTKKKLLSECSLNSLYLLDALSLWYDKRKHTELKTTWLSLQTSTSNPTPTTTANPKPKPKPNPKSPPKSK